jgi:DoxX-like family
VATGYLLGASLIAPHLWADPLGPLVKVLPAVVLGLVAASLLDER